MAQKSIGRIINTIVLLVNTFTPCLLYLVSQTINWMGNVSAYLEKYSKNIHNGPEGLSESSVAFSRRSVQVKVMYRLDIN